VRTLPKPADSSSGSFVQTMVLTDIATGWTECVPVRTRESGLVIAALNQARSLFPFPLQGVDFDNDSAFMNERVVCWCRSQGLEVTRSRAYRKNDQAWVEQKNGAIVRRLVGYGRLVGAEATVVLGRLYDVVRLYGNLFLRSAAREDTDRRPRRQTLPSARAAYRAGGCPFRCGRGR
ncbi:integrase catalytic domain-containing protein, partial [Sinorhizobium fredii]|uniref:integrase catalytic domain-containing protein n=1 Tax=Rhizobium fredii TaxID=380 RepID=UPI001FCC698F